MFLRQMHMPCGYSHRHHIPLACILSLVHGFHYHSGNQLYLAARHTVILHRPFPPELPKKAEGRALPALHYCTKLSVTYFKTGRIFSTSV